MRLPALAALFAFAAMSSFAANSDQKYFLYVGSYAHDILVYDFDAATGELKLNGPAGQIDSPSWITADPSFKYLYAVSELDGRPGGVGAFAINRETGMLQKLNQLPSGGGAPCFITTDRTGKMVMAANYMTGGVSAYPVKEDGSLGDMTSLMSAVGHGPNTERQEGPHAHDVVLSPDNSIVYVPDLGLDEIRMFQLDPEKGTLGPHNPPFIKQSPGYGPRHLTFSPDGSFAYLMNELKSVVSVYRHDKTTGNLTKIQDVSSVPSDFQGTNGPAEILVDASGKHVYATNRGADTIAVFSVDHGKGTLHLIQTVPAQGHMPRGLVIAPGGKFILVGNQNTNNFALYSIDSSSGKLTATGTVIQQDSPVSFLFVPKA